MPARHLLTVAQHAGRIALRAHGFHSRTLNTALARLHVYDARGHGALPTVVVLHGIGSAATQFARVLIGLRPHVRRVLAPDLPGHGFSEPARVPLTPELLFGTVCELLDALVDEPFVLVGSSLGGALSLRYALDHPARVQRLVLVSPAGAQMSTAEWEALLDTFRVHTLDDARRLIHRLYHRAPFYAAAFAPGLRDTLRTRAVRDVLASVQPTDLPTPERLRELTVPTLLLWGQSERLLPASSLAYFRAHLPAHTTIEEAEGFGHCPHVDAPLRLAERVVTFASGR